MPFTPPTSISPLACLLSALVAATCPARAADSTSLVFQTHAAFFSAETKQATPEDPQVFVKDSAAPPGTGPQGIKHDAGVRPAHIAEDPGSSPLVAADGKALSFTLAEWLAATGDVSMTATPAGRVMVKVTFRHLRPDALYSLFENHFDQTPIGFTPLDGVGTANSFKTDPSGAATMTVLAPGPITHANAIAVILHDDGQAHGAKRGDIGQNARTHLIVRPQS